MTVACVRESVKFRLKKYPALFEYMYACGPKTLTVSITILIAASSTAATIHWTDHAVGGMEGDRNAAAMSGPAVYAPAMVKGPVCILTALASLTAPMSIKIPGYDVGGKLIFKRVGIAVAIMVGLAVGACVWSIETVNEMESKNTEQSSAHVPAVFKNMSEIIEGLKTFVESE